MTHPNVPPLNPWHEVAANLVLIAEDLRTIAPDVPVAYAVTLQLQPVCGTDDDAVDQVDAISHALFGEPGTVRPMSNGTHHYDRRGKRGQVNVQVFSGISSERAVRIAARQQLEAKEAELARLRAEVAELRARTGDDGLGFSREPDDPTPVSPARAPMHVADVVSGIATDGDRVGDPKLIAQDGGCE